MSHNPLPQKSVAQRCIHTLSHAPAGTDLHVGHNNAIGPPGAEAIAQHCPDLVALGVGFGNQLTAEGVRVIVQHCTALEARGLSTDSCPFKIVHQKVAKSLPTHADMQTSLPN